MNFKVGDKVVLRNGMRGIVVGTDETGQYPLTLDVEFMAYHRKDFTNNGTYYLTAPSEFDIISIVESESDAKIAALQAEIADLKAKLCEIGQELVKYKNYHGSTEKALFNVQYKTTIYPANGSGE